MQAKLTDGRLVRLEQDDFNVWGQINLRALVERGIAADTSEMCDLLGAAQSSVRYGFVYPEVDLLD